MRDLKHLTYFEDLLQEANNALVVQAQAEGKKCVAFVCENTPEPLMNLDNTFGVRLHAPNTGSMDIATYYMTSLLCETSRSLLERAVEGGFNFADCVIAPDGCTMINRCVENMELLKTMGAGKDHFFYEYMEIPLKADDNGVDLLVLQCKNHILKPLHDAFGTDVSDAAIRRAVAEHNRVCALIRALGDFRKEVRPRITGYEFHVLTLATYVAPKYLLIDKLEETLEEVRSREPEERAYRARIALVGSEVDDSEFIRLIEDTGAYVCADRFCFGSLPGRDPIVLTDEEDALTQICRQYVYRGQCPRTMNMEKVYGRKQYVQHPLLDRPDAHARPGIRREHRDQENTGRCPMMVTNEGKRRIGDQQLGVLFDGGKVRCRREWRGVKDTLYDYGRWLYILSLLAKFIVKPRNIKAMFRYRWMANYLAVPHMVDKFTMGLRDEALRIVHTSMDFVVYDVASTMDDIFRGDRRTGNDVEFSKKCVLTDENEMTAFMMGFPNVKAILREVPTMFVANLLTQNSSTHYLDVAQQFGIAGDVCPMPEAEAGCSIDDDFAVLGVCAVQCNTTCDGSLMGNGIIAKRLEREYGIPTFQLVAPMRHQEDDVQDYAAQDIRNVIAFVEEHTGQHWDWSHYFECAKRVNDATRNRLAWLEMNSTPYPQFVGAPFSLYNDTNYMGNCGRSAKFPPIDRKIMRYAERGNKAHRMMAPEYRHRAIVWGVQPQYCIDMLNWMVHCWGIVPLTDMLSLVNTRMIADTDTPENREQAFYDMAWLNENMIMRNRTHGGYRVLVDELWEFCETMHADMVIMWEHMSCKALTGMHGQFEEQARVRGIHLVWVCHDLCDPRVYTRQAIRDQLNAYMRTVMREEPLDPSIEVLPDENAW